jgi:serine/threonine protein kinase/tetratricopeptide (TPR) repeat protein
MESPRGPEPEWIGRYHILGRLGSGGMGEVFLGWDDQLKRKVAIKRIRQDIGLSAEQRERLLHEAQHAASVCHPFVVQIHEVLPDENAIVMEYVEGRTLAERLAEGPLETPEILRLALETAEGLAAAHAAGLVHRDLKAANVTNASGHAKILDFGLSRPVDRAPDDPSLTRPGTVRGTPHAMSPEQVCGEEVDERSDLFSLGSLVHEMLTRRPPFQGKDTFESMEKVVHDTPVDPLLARPDLPEEGAWLLLWLLMKDRDGRPNSAREVIAVLERLQTAPFMPSAVAQEKSVSELPTEEATIRELPERLRRESPPSPPREPVLKLPAPPFREPIPSPPRRLPASTRRRIVLASAAMALLVAGALLTSMAGHRTSPEQPLRIAVIHPVVSTNDEELTAASVRVYLAALEALTELKGIKPLDPREITTFHGAPVEVGKAVGAGQVLSITLKREGGTALVSFRLTEVSSGNILGSDSTSVPLGRENRETLAAAVIDRIQEDYPDHTRRPARTAPFVKPEDLETFMDIQEQVDAGKVRREDLRRLEEIFRTSPDFLEAPILAARIAYSLYLSQREPADLERASTYIHKARLIVPEDPRTLRQELKIALIGNRINEAEKILEKLSELFPGDPDILPLQARLAEKQGRTDDAKSLFTEAVEQVPSWQNRYQLADFEARHGRIENARAQIDEILRQDHKNVWAQRKLGEIELNHGDLARAERIYQDLVPSIPEKALVCLGNVRQLRGNLGGAADSYQRALAITPDYPPALINLAEVSLELGRKREAEELYRQALARLEELDTDLSPNYSLYKAQCLARLGRPREAVEIAQALGPKAADSPASLHQMALVYSLVGERALALEHAKAALARGYQPRWFTGSAFRWLRESPELRSRLRTAQP